MIIEGILTEDFVKRNLGKPELDAMCKTLSGLITAHTALDVHEYLTSLDADPDVKRYISEKLGDQVSMFMYAKKMRNSPEMALVSRTYIVNFVSEMKEQHDQYTVDEMVKIFKDIIDHKDIIYAKVLPNPRADYEKFCSQFANLCPTADERSQLNANSERLYHANAKTTFTGLNLLIRRMRDLEMMCKGFDYMNNCMSRGVPEGGSYSFG